MKRRLWILGTIAGAVLFALIVAVMVLHSDWLRGRVRAEILRQVEKSTGGRAELGGFDYDWRHLSAQLDRFVLHGSEAAGEAPLLSVERIVLHLRIISLLQGDIRLQSIDANRPQAHLIFYPDGHTNIPGSKIDRGTTPRKIIDLRIGNFKVSDGMFTVETPEAPMRRIPWRASGENLTAGLMYDSAAARYTGEISLGVLHVLSLDVGLTARLSFEKNRIAVPHASLKSGDSSVELTNVAVDGFQSPVTTGQYKANVLLPAVARLVGSKYTVKGTAVSDGSFRFASLSEYSVTGSLHGTAIDFDKVRNVRLDSRFETTPAKTVVSGVRLFALGGEAAGEAETSDFVSFRASGRLAHFDVRELARLETRQPLPYDGLVSGTFDAHGRPWQLNVDSHLTLSPAAQGPPVHGDVALRYEGASARIDLGQSWLQLPHTRLDLSGTLGERLTVKVQSADFKDLTPAIDALAAGSSQDFAFGSLAFEGNINGPLANPVVSGHASFKDGRYHDQLLQSFAGDIAVSRASATASHAEVTYGGVPARGAGSVALSDWRVRSDSAIRATIETAGASLADILSAAGHKEVEVSGTLNVTARIAGSVGSPLADADVALTRGFIFGQPFDSISGRLQAVNRSDQALTGVFVSGSKRVSITARFAHAGTQFPAGKLEFNLTSNTMPLNQIALIRQRQPGIRGFGKFHADGLLKIGHDAEHAIQFSLAGLNADASANEVELDGRNLGDAHFTAQTVDDVMTARFDSNAAKASIHGEGTVHLAGDYPSSGRVSFSNAGINSLAALIVKEDDAKNISFDGIAEGSASFNGPLRKPEQMTASFDIPHIEIKPLAGSPVDKNFPGFAISNAGPLRATLRNSSIRIESARFKAPETDITLDGALGLSDRSQLDLRMRGTVSMAVAQTLNPDMSATGSVTLDASVKGGWLAPNVSGHASIRNADFHYSDFSNGLTGANGEVTFTGSRATIQSFTAQSGGGRVDVTGFATLTGGVLGFRVEARAREVRVRYPEGISSVSDADLTFAGTSERSQTSGTITVRRVSINPKSDAATILANSAAPVQTAAATKGLASNMNLDIQITTAADVNLQTSVTQSLQADASLRLRGTATNPALLGRINVIQGEMVFFGNKYSINTGSISFVNPAKIDPILNIDLETRARGVDVILTVAGSIAKLGLSYRSDPPLQFSDIVALLATGRPPTDSTLAVRDTGQSQNFQQLGATALIGQAIANPVAGRLQRFFGVSRLKIDPSLTGITGSPEARLTIEQQVTPDILFTYITDVSSTSTQLIRVEWSFDPHWSAILIREGNGYVGLDFAFKKRFK